MKLQTQLSLAVGSVLAFTFIGLGILTYENIKEKSIQEALHLAEQVRGILMATRRVYHHQFLKSGIELTPETLEFLPAHALAKISTDFANWSDTGLIFNNVSDRPRNPHNRADAIEMAAIRHFLAHPQEKLRFVEYYHANGSQYYHYSRPIWVEQYCLKCHGKPSSSPPTIRKTYTTSFNDQVGDLRGILSIKILASDINQHAMDYFARDLSIQLVIFFIIILMLGVLRTSCRWQGDCP